KKPEPAPAPKWQPYYEEASPGDSGVVVTPQWEQAQARRKAEAEAVRQATTAIQVPADQRARVALVESKPIDARFLDDLKRREQAMRQAANDMTPDSGERAKQLTNWAFDGAQHPDKITVPTPWGPTDGKPPVDDVSKRKEKGVRMFVDAGELRSVLQKSEERALDMLEKMEKNLVRGGDGFSALRDLKHRVAGELGTGKAVVKLGFTKTPWAGVNETLIAVSLKNLMAHPATEEARTLGNLKRLVGYMLDPEGDDLVLLGVPGEKDGKAHLLLDDLTLMLKAVWVEGQRPGCTLDPDAQDFSKDQKARVFGIPHQSNMAKVMLDADYEMKKINFGVIRFDDDPIPGFVCNFDSALKRYKDSLDAGEQTPPSHSARFWLTPCRPEPGDMMVEPGRRFVMFQTRVQVMTEAMAISGDALVGTGKVDPVDDKSARIFTAHMEEIEARRPIFRQLHALFDLEILCQILAENHVRSSLLERIAARSVGTVSVATGYPSCKNEAAVEGHPTFTYSVQGGVMIYLKLRRKYIRDMEQKELRELETACLDAFCGRAVSIGDSAALKALLRDRQRIEKDRRTADLSFERGCQKYAAKEYDAAEKFLTEAIDRDSDFPEACTQRALTRLAVKNWKGAIADCDLALKKDPELWPAFLLRSRARSELGDEKAAAEDFAKYKELLAKDKFLQQMVADAATR
ncbi:MAG TPA: DUF1598 domain-containing protein, partial [Planctomycetota bacterium]|nr:DUF1598 domain-containing protein [Planctomycetota bacterium]